MTNELCAKNTVVYADDDTDDIQLVKDALLNYSQNVELVTASNGIEIVSYLKNLSTEEPSPCLIILDINMPRMNGKEALVNIRQMKRYEEIPVVLFTTSSQQRDKDFAIKYKAGFLTKPIDYKQMEAIANNFIEHCTNEIQKNIRRQKN